MRADGALSAGAPDSTTIHGVNGPSGCKFMHGSKFRLQGQIQGTPNVVREVLPGYDALQEKAVVNLVSIHLVMRLRPPGRAHPAGDTLWYHGSRNTFKYSAITVAHGFLRPHPRHPGSTYPFTPLLAG